MPGPAKLLPLLMLTASCAPQVSSPPLPLDTSPVQDTDEDTDVVQHDTDTEWIPALEADPIFDPPGGGFVDSVEVTLSSSSGTGQVFSCTAAPGLGCEPQPTTGPILLTSSAVLHARVDIDARAGRVQARSFVSMTHELADIESPIPVMVMWTDRGLPSSSQDAVMGLDVFEPGDSTTRLSDAPTDSGRCRVKIRGSSTAHLEKSSYDLELWQPDSDEDRPVALMGMPADGDWVLYAPYSFDEALIRNALGYTLSNRVGRYAPRTRMVELYVAGGGGPVSTNNYRGVYTLIEEIERAGHRVDITAIQPEDVNEPEITGGYLFKRDRAGDGESGFEAGTGGGAFVFEYHMAWVDPEEAEIATAQQAYLDSQLNSLAGALLQPDFTDPISGLHYSEIIDVDSWIDHHILNVVFKNPDSLRLSAYMYKDREGPIHAGPIWDLDRSAGANDSRATYPTLWDATNQTSDTTAVFTFGWYGGLFADPDFRDRYWARWRELLEGELAIENILAAIEELAEPLAEPAARNARTWGAAPFPGEILALRGWFESRLAWIEACIEATPDPRDCR